MATSERIDERLPSKRVPRRRPPSWAEFEKRLFAALGRMAYQTYLVINAPAADGDSVYYVQFAQGGKSGFLAEAVSNRYLTGTAALSPDQEEQMSALGWMWPTPGIDRDPNYSRQWPMPVPFAEVGRLAVRTLREVYGVRSPAALTYSSFRKGGPSFPVPSLGIPATLPTPTTREQHPAVPTPEQLKPIVEAAIKAFLRVDTVTYDADGDIPIQMGSAMVFVRIVAGTPPQLAVFAPLLWGVQASPSLLEAINDINTRIRFGRLFWTGTQVMAAMEVPAMNLGADDVAFACLQVGSIADHFDDELQARLGGTTMFGTPTGRPN